MTFAKSLIVQLVSLNIYNGDIWCSIFIKIKNKNLKNIYWSFTSEAWNTITRKGKQIDKSWVDAY